MKVKLYEPPSRENISLRLLLIGLYGHRMKLKRSCFQSSDNTNKKEDGSYPGFGYISLISDPGQKAKYKYCNFAYEPRHEKTGFLHMRK